ncbi:MAG: hemerythrin domain-containing protein [Ndongobacter sp.]|nr:hemerythrin domain-containing protein [Ndongobacter sp.]
MYSVELMVAEHDRILRMIEVVRRMCVGVLEGGEVPEDDFRQAIDFIRHFADGHHHGKEEDFLFPEMVSHLGPAAQNLVTHGMLVEHDLGRNHVREWEMALDRYRETHAPEDKLDILAEAMGYGRLLRRHIEKENNVVYTFAERALPPEVRQQIDEKSRAYEERTSSKETRARYDALLGALEKKYVGNCAVSAADDTSGRLER